MLGAGEAQQFCDVGDALPPNVEPSIHDVDDLGITEDEQSCFVVLEGTRRGGEAYHPPSLLACLDGFDLFGDEHLFVPSSLQVYDHTLPCIHISE